MDEPLRMLTVMTRSAHTQEIIIIERQVRPVLQVEYVVHRCGRSESAFLFANLALEVVSLKNLQTLLLPDGTLVELPFLNELENLLERKSHTGAHLPLVYRCCCSGISTGSPPATAV